MRALDLSRLFAGNLLTQILGDFGADVIKVEPPESDTLRAWTVEGIATHWKVYARNKRSLGMDLRPPDAVAGLYGASAATIALREAERSGRRQTVDPSLLEPLFAVLGRQAENVAYFEAAEVTIGAINDIAAILRDPRVAARGLLADDPDAEMGWLPRHAVVPTVAATPGSIRAPAPRLDEHNREVLAAAGMTADYQRLAAEKVIAGMT